MRGFSELIGPNQLLCPNHSPPHRWRTTLRAKRFASIASQMEFAIPTTLDFLYCSLQRLRWPKMFSVHRGQPDKVTMVAQYICELSLLSYDCAQQPASLVASAALCLALACLRCGLWRDGAPGPSESPMPYWTASMAQVHGIQLIRRE